MCKNAKNSQVFHNLFTIRIKPFFDLTFIAMEESHSSLSLLFFSSSILQMAVLPGTYTFLPFFNIIKQ